MMLMACCAFMVKGKPWRVNKTSCFPSGKLPQVAQGCGVAPRHTFRQDAVTRRSPGPSALFDHVNFFVDPHRGRAEAEGWGPVEPGHGANRESDPAKQDARAERGLRLALALISERRRRGPYSVFTPDTGSLSSVFIVKESPISSYHSGTVEALWTWWGS